MTSPLTEGVRKDLRGNFLIYFLASHFTMGQCPLSYESEFTHEYKPYNVEHDKNPYLAAMIRQSHFTLGNSTENPYRSVYETTLKPFDLREAYVAPAPNKNFTSSFNVGLHDRPFHMTEAQLMYKKPPGEAYKVDNDIKANIRFIKGSHFTLGSGNGGIGVEGGSGGNGANGGNGGSGGVNV